MTRELTCTVIGHLDLSLLARLDGTLGVFRNCTATGGHSLIDHQGGLSDIGKGERAADHRILLGECSEIVRQLIKLNLCGFLSQCDIHSAEKQHSE